MDATALSPLFAPLLSVGAVATVAVALEQLRQARATIKELKDQREEDRERFTARVQSEREERIRLEERLNRVSDTGREVAQLEAALDGKFEKHSQNIGELRREMNTYHQGFTAKLSKHDHALRELELTKRSKESDNRFPAQRSPEPSSARLRALEETDPPPPEPGRPRR